ncbi:hypothetical protein BDY24DRAFT_374952 [Mrakia frigida]|uniref:uncharacterized protein n=1 Tax=Mrakia frigida TaxID=29902 RepID=UPI003FCBF7F6
MLASTAQRELLQRKNSTIDSNLPLHSPLSSSPTNGTTKLFGNWKRSKSPTHNGTPSNDFTVRRRSEDRPMSPSNSRWAFPSIPGRQNDDRPRSRQSRLSMTGSSSHSNSNEGSYGSTSSAARRASQVQESRDSLEVSSEFALSSTSGSDLPLSRIGAERMSMDTARSARPSIDDGTRGHRSQGSRDCVVQ